MTGYGNNFNNGYMGMNNYMGFQPQFQKPIGNYIPNNMSQGNFQEVSYQGIRVVESEKSVENIDVPMDGKPYYFVKADGSEIYVKFWTEEMKTKINKFGLIKEDVDQHNEKVDLDSIVGKYFDILDKNIGDKINSINESISNISKQTQKPRTQKEG